MNVSFTNRQLSSESSQPLKERIINEILRVNHTKNYNPTHRNSISQKSMDSTEEKISHRDDEFTNLLNGNLKEFYIGVSEKEPIEHKEMAEQVPLKEKSHISKIKIYHERSNVIKLPKRLMGGKIKENEKIKFI
mmetsp:Transcript_18077/g.16005  ORF Transcript_18077/g.16005 Transcript_18077/m.16005 type:complete len:134 (+) Transcript_18077:171-572(+)